MPATTIFGTEYFDDE
jgi:peptidyl-prolyl cis-trans isomerase-like 4